MAHLPTELEARGNTLPPIFALVKVGTSCLLENVAYQGRSVSNLWGSHGEGTFGLATDFTDETQIKICRLESVFHLWPKFISQLTVKSEA